VRDALAQVQRPGEMDVVGISPDPPNGAERRGFSDKLALTFPLLLPIGDHVVATDYGVWGEKSMYG